MSDAPPDDNPVPPTTSPSDKSPAKPRPTRPSTSGTELALVTRRKAAQEAHRRALLKEREYVARKRSANAKVDVVEAREHFAKGFGELREGFKAVFGAVRGVGSVLREKQVEAARKEEVRQLEIAEKKRAILEARQKEREKEEEDAKAAKTAEATVEAEATTEV